MNDKPMPYVYRGTHKVTGEFYIGYRETNTKPASQDLGIEYFTSSKNVEGLGFDNFDWHIVSEFISGDDAYDFEQELIAENFYDPLCLNEHHHKDGVNRFKRTGPMSDESKARMRGKRRTDEAKRNIAAGQKGKTLSDETKNKIAQANIGKTKSEDHKEKLGLVNLGKKRSEETKARLKIAVKESNSQRAAKMAQDWLIIHPDGSEELINNLKEFCQRYDLNPKCMSAVAHGRNKAHKGFRCIKVE